MSQRTGATRLQLPIAKAVGTQHQPIAVNATGAAAPQVAVPPPEPLIINGRSIMIDVRTMSNTDIVNAINTVPGVTASIDGQGRLVISGANSIEGESALRIILGI